MPTLDPIQYGLAGIIVASLLWGGSLKVETIALESDLVDERKTVLERDREIIDLKKTIETSEKNYTTCSTSLTAQNEAIEKLRTTIANFKPKTVTETVYKYLPADTNVTRGNCEDTKTVIDFIRTNHP